MASLQLNHIYKVYPNGTKAVNDFCMDIEDKEFIVFVGPSGCGKSTTLRMIAGLEEITAGELRIGDLVVNDMEPKDRDIAMVFQNYALYPHMTVYENMAFGLRLRKLPKDEIDQKIREAAKILGITEYLERRPKEMSGGQRQRVALGRAIVRNPKVFLLDEPLSNLDAKLRTAMRSEISKLHHKLQTTFIYVTHDQVEAMTMGTRIVVMKDGFVQQIDTPRNLYRFPANLFVAGFIGTPQMNFFSGKLVQHDDKVAITLDNTPVELDAPLAYFNKANRAYLDGSKPVILGLRAEHISTNPKLYPFKAKCRVSHVEELGTDCQVYADFNIESEDIVGESPTRVIVKAPAGSTYDVDQIIEVSLDLSQIHVFDAETENTIAPRIPQEIVTEGIVANGSLSMLGSVIELPEAINVENGKYNVTIPTSAVSLKGKAVAKKDDDVFVRSKNASSLNEAIEAEVIEQEDVNGQLLVHLRVADRVLFAIVDKDAKVSKKVKIDIDLKQIALDREGETVVAPLDCNNTLGGVISKHKVKVEKTVVTKRKVKAEQEVVVQTTQADGETRVETNTENVDNEQIVDFKVKKVTEMAFSLDIAGASVDCPRNIAMKLINGGGQHIFGKALEFQFTPYQVAVAETGIVAKVEKIVNYGAERFAVCSIGDKTVNVAVDKKFNASEVNLVLDVEQLAIVEVARGIRLA